MHNTVISHFLHQLNVVVLTLIWTPWSDSADANLECAEYECWNLYYSSIAKCLASYFCYPEKKSRVFSLIFQARTGKKLWEIIVGIFMGPRNLMLNIKLVPSTFLQYFKYLLHIILLLQMLKLSFGIDPISNSSKKALDSPCKFFLSLWLQNKAFRMVKR